MHEVVYVVKSNQINGADMSGKVFYVQVPVGYADTLENAIEVKKEVHKRRRIPLEEMIITHKGVEVKEV